MPNRLASETSPYLLQHAENPVDWYPWGPEALERAAELDRPILLSVGYSACHWCHVMERESFEDAETARFMNEHFVPIKVDREERPDVDSIYMEAVQGMTGHGGWPLTAFLDTEGVPFYGGTYFPPTQRQGMPSFRMVMEAVVQSWGTQREQIREAAGRIRTQLGHVGRIEPSADQLTRGVVEGAVSALRVAADMEHGGFGSAPKFPPASALELMLTVGEPGPVETTLNAIAAGGINDHVGGGFARYSVDAIWLVPHFEKMLYDNALLARAYLHGYQALGDERWRETAERTLDWALREMRGPEGGFFSALDADSEGEEGLFYVWTPEQIREVLAGAGLGDTAEELIAYYGVTDAGNFEGRNIPNLIGRWDTSPPERLDEARAALYEARSQRVWPGLDDKRLASWNALMISALAEAGAVLGRDDYLDAARATAGFVLDEMRDADGRLLRSWKDGEAKLNAYLEDHAYLLEALLTLYEATFEVRWFDAARETADAMIARFADPERGGFFTTSEDHEQLIARRKDVDDHPIPSGNSSAAFGLLRLAALTGEGSYAERAESVFRLFGRVAAEHPQAVPHMLRAIDFHLSPVHEVALVGRRGDRGARRAGRGGALAAPPAPGAGGRAGGQRAPRAAARAAHRRRPGGRLRLRELRLPGAGDRARGARSVAGRVDFADGRENRAEAQDSRQARQGLLRRDRRPRPRPRGLAVEAGRTRPDPRDRRPEGPERHQGLLQRPLLRLPRLRVRDPRARRERQERRLPLALDRHLPRSRPVPGPGPDRGEDRAGGLRHAPGRGRADRREQRVRQRRPDRPATRPAAAAGLDRRPGRHRRLQREDRRARPPAPPARLAAQSQRTGVVVPDSQSSRRIA